MHPMTVAACVVLALLGCLGTVTASTTNTTTTIVSPSTSSAGIPLRLCFIPTAYIPADSIFVRHGGFAAKYFGQRYPEFDVEFTFATLDGGTTLTSIARGLMQESVQRCHALLGPLASSTCLGISPVINMPWLSHTASAVELANKDFHPWFSSVMPTDSFTGGALAAAVISRGWRTVSAVVIDTAYSKSYYAGFVEGMQHYGDGGNIERTVVVLVDATADEMRVQLRQLQTINTRIITFLAGLDGALERLVDVVLELGLDRTHVLVFGDGPCATGWARLSQLHGVLCTSYLNNASTEVPYIDAWLAHNTSDFDYFADFGVPPPPADYIWGGVLNSVLPDAVHALLETFHRQKARGGSLYDRQAINDLLRTVRIPGGISGSIELNANGERVGAAMGFYNVQPSNNSAGYRLHEYGQLSAASEIWLTDNSPLFWRTSNTYGDQPKVADDPDDDGLTASPTLLIAVLAAVGLLLILVALIAKVGCSEDGMLLKLMRNGLLSSTIVAVLTFADVVISLLALIDVLSDNYSTTFVGLYGALIAIACIVSLTEIVIIVGFVWRWLSLRGGMSLNDVTTWHTRIAYAGAVALFAEEIPLAIVCAVGLALRPDSPSLLILATLILSCVLLGIKASDVRFVFHQMRSGSEGVAVQRQITEQFPEYVPLNRRSDYFAVRAVTDFIATCSRVREGNLVETAKRIVITLRSDDVESDEFFAVVWNIMGDLYSNLDDLDTDAGGGAVRVRRTTRTKSVATTNSNGSPLAGTAKPGNSFSDSTVAESQRGTMKAHSQSTAMTSSVAAADGRGGLRSDDDDDDDDDDIFVNYVEVHDGKVVEREDDGTAHEL